MAKKKKEEEYEVEKLLDVKEDKKKGKVFLVKWKGYSAEENTWEPVANIVDTCKDMMDALEKKKNGNGAAAKKAEKAEPAKRGRGRPPASEKKAEPAKRGPGRPPASAAKRAKTASTRAMTTKPTRDGAGKREAPAPAPAPAAKKQKTVRSARSVDTARIQYHRRRRPIWMALNTAHRRASPRIAAHRRASPRIATHRRASPRIATLTTHSIATHEFTQIDIEKISKELMKSLLGGAAPKEEKAEPKAAKSRSGSGASRKRPREESAVMEVDQIVGMRARKGALIN